MVKIDNRYVCEIKRVSEKMRVWERKEEGEKHREIEREVYVCEREEDVCVCVCLTERERWRRDLFLLFESIKLFARHGIESNH